MRRDTRGSRPRWRTLLGVLAGAAAFAATGVLALTRTGGSTPALARVPLAALGRLAAAPAAGRPGPEGVPIPGGRPLAPPRPLRPGELVDGISCETGEQVAFHVHAHLRIVVRGRSRRVPAGIGIGVPYQAVATPAGPFVAAATCFAWLHTHAADGIVHIESPVERTYTLGEFFDVWGRALDRTRVGPARGHVTALVDGRVFTGDPRAIPLLAHEQIELEVGRPLVAPETIAFPNGL